jgi:predicted dehydrogenase
MQHSFSDAQHIVVAGYVRRSSEMQKDNYNWREPLHLECEDFVNSICTGSPPRANGQVGLEVVRILAQTQEALARQKGSDATRAESMPEKSDLLLSF